MASSMVGTRLNSDVIEQLQKKADTEGKKIADVVRELILSGLAQEKKKNQETSGESAEVLEPLKRLDKRLEQVLEKKEEKEEKLSTLKLKEMEKRLTDLLTKAVTASAASQFYARAGTLNTIDLVSIWATQVEKVDNEDAREEVAARLDTDCQDFADWWLKGG